MQQPALHLLPGQTQLLQDLARRHPVLQLPPALHRLVVLGQVEVKFAALFLPGFHSAKDCSSGLVGGSGRSSNLSITSSIFPIASKTVFTSGEGPGIGWICSGSLTLYKLAKS